MAPNNGKNVLEQLLYLFSNQHEQPKQASYQDNFNIDASPASSSVRQAMEAYTQQNPDYLGAIQSFQTAIKTDPSRSEYFNQNINSLINEKKKMDELLKRKQAERLLLEQQKRESEYRKYAGGDYAY